MAYIRLSDGVKKGFEQDMVSALTTLGYYAMMDAYGKHSFTHRTRNLHDSYASAVYVNGNLIESSIRYVGGVVSKEADPVTKKTGRETVNDYLHSHRYGAANNEIVLVVIAAMYYAGILEAGDRNTGSRGPGAKYIVISPAREYINKNYWTAVYKVYDKYGIKDKPKAKVIKGESLK
jgi:hypothetical protein